MEEPMNQDERMSDQAKTWLQENLRIIVSIFIVAAIALGIYSYSQRSNESLGDETLADVATDDGSSVTADKGVTNKAGTVGSTGSTKTMTVPADLSKETATSFVETATRGDGTTHLARRALMNYLEKSPDSGLSGEHKVYIEDYLRKHAGYKGSVHVGTSVEFSKDLVRQAIDQSKTLTPKQLQNLKKYSQRVALYRS
ncbi:MAG: hypothetical protein ABI747_02090 [Candidatus Moraniibacteriota bacterium]